MERKVKVMLSASKYIGGHSDMTGGALVTKDPGLAQRRWEMMSSWGFIDYEGFRLKASGFPFWNRDTCTMEFAREGSLLWPKLSAA